MTKPKPPKPKVEKDATKRRAGFLVCGKCNRAVPYQGMTDPVSSSGDEWPLHRCGLEVGRFDRFTLDDPTRLPLPPLNESAS